MVKEITRHTGIETNDRGGCEQSPKKTALLFPGQGAQYPGMGLDIYRRFAEARQVFEEAEAVLGPGFIDIIFEGPAEKLTETATTQPAILTVSTAICRVLTSHGIKAEGLAGLSLGEYSALVAADAVAFSDALPLVAKRGQLMQEATPPDTGGMIAIMGLSHEDVIEICKRARESGVVAAANFNCPGQIVISGEKAALEHAHQLASAAGAKRITPLKVSAPFHSILLQPIEKELAGILETISFNRPEIPVVFNINAAWCSEPQKIKENLVLQVSHPILWEQSVHTLLSRGINHFISIGPGTSPARLMKRISPESETVALDSAPAIEKFLGGIE
ncbi:MAG: ACP S-malonyltransferase [Bacillota bacterium]|nr:ACP S-malonyltransferase [Bacillota bacterium]